MFFINELLFLIFFNSSGREFPLRQMIEVFFKFVETKGREKLSDEDCLVSCLCKVFVFTNACSRGNLPGCLLISNIILAV